MSSNLAGKQLFSIGDVISALGNDYPDLTISKIRFLESEGLINPLRAPSGYRKFTRFDRDRIRYILELQHEHYLPLKVIKDHLEAIDNGTEKPIPLKRVETLAEKLLDSSNFNSPVNSKFLISAWLSRNEFLLKCKCSDSFLQEIEEIGLIAAKNDKFRISDIQLVETVRNIFELGVPIKHLRIFKLAADRELALAEAVTKPIRQRKFRQSEQRANDQVLELLNKFAKLQQLLIANGLSQDLS